MRIFTASKTRFALGDIIITANARAQLSHSAVSNALVRHVNADWGDVPPSDAELNDRSLITGDRLLSAYQDGSVRFWIITEANRSATTILLPEDY